MTASDQDWQDKISKVVRRVAKDLIANDETEISEVIRRRLFQDLGSEKIRKNVAKAYGDWCFERRAQLPPEWTAVDSAATEAKAREIPAAPIRGLLPVPSSDAVGLPAQVAGAAAVPADARHPGDAGPVDFDRSSGRLPQGSHRAAHHARLGAARRTRVPQRGAGTTGRVTAHCGD